MGRKPLAGHTFLATLGKRRLRPGGVEATEWLFEQASIAAGKDILEVACNQGTSSIECVKRYGVHLTACDLDDDALTIARQNAEDHQISDKISFLKADARNLPFEDNQFDIVLNEAMLTMLSPDDKKKALAEYYRVLKPGGKLLTHDVVLLTDNPAKQKEVRASLSRAIYVDVHPYTEEGWINTFASLGFAVIPKVGPMSLMSPMGMIKDEGFRQTVRIARNALRPENRKQFKSMFNVFKTYKHELGYIAVVSTKP